MALKARGRWSDTSRPAPRRTRFGLYLVLSLIGGSAAGIIALTEIGLPGLFSLVQADSTQPEISASMIFPAAQPLQQTVDVYDQHPEGGDSGGDDQGGDH